MTNYKNDAPASQCNGGGMALTEVLYWLLSSNDHRRLIHSFIHFLPLIIGDKLEYVCIVRVRKCVLRFCSCCKALVCESYQAVKGQS